jgi:type II secretory pathway component PulF
LVRVLSSLAADARRRQTFNETVARSFYGAAGLFVLAVVLTPLGVLFSSGFVAYIGSVVLPLGIFLLIGICGYWIAGFMGRDDAMRLHRDRLLLSLPVLGGTVRFLSWSRFCSALSLAYTAGMDMAAAVRYALGAMGNQALILAHSGLITTVERGDQLSSYFRRARDVPEPLSQMIITGELSGTLDSSLQSASSLMEDGLNTRMRNATSLLGGLLSLCAAAYVVFRVISFYVGYFNRISSF